MPILQPFGPILQPFPSSFIVEPDFISKLRSTLNLERLDLRKKFTNLQPKICGDFFSAHQNHPSQQK